MEPVTGSASGTAHITLSEGDNSIIVVKGANDFISPEYVQKAKKVIEESDIVLVQQEIPEETVEYLADICNMLQKRLLLNPAPARKLSEAVIQQASFLTPNEHEFEILFDGRDRTEVLTEYPNKLFITEGKMASVTLMDMKKRLFQALKWKRWIQQVQGIHSMLPLRWLLQKEKVLTKVCCSRTGQLPFP